MTITAHSKPHRPQCDAAYRTLSKQGIDYRSIDTIEDIDTFEYIKGLGYQQAPVVVAGDSYWSGFRSGRIKAAVATHLDPASLAVGQA